MVNSIIINRVIFQLLSENEELNNLIEGKIYPLVAEKSTTYPFIVFRRNGITTSFNKTNFYEDSVSFTIIVCDNSYKRSTEIANIVRKICEFKDFKNEDMRICDSHLVNVDETFYEDAYIQTLTFSAKVF